MKKTKLTIGLPFTFGILVCAFLWHLAVGAKSIPLNLVLESFFTYDPKLFEHVVIQDLRLPRALIAVMVGAALSCAGALMQGVTRNPLAEPATLGLLSGAAFAVVVYVAFSEAKADAIIPLLAAVGALATAAGVWGISACAAGSRGIGRAAGTAGQSLTLVLTGAAVSAFLGAIITFVNIMDERTLEYLRGWLVGSISSANSTALYYSMPWFIVGLLLALGMARQVSALALGEDTAIGLGVNVVRLKNMVLLAVIILSAAAVSVAGPMGFVGLVIPHIARLCLGADYRYIIPFSCLFGAIYLLVVDIAARIVLAPLEISTGLLTALLGAPFFVWLVRAKL